MTAPATFAAPVAPMPARASAVSTAGPGTAGPPAAPDRPAGHRADFLLLLGAEAVKLRRSAVWVVVLLLPLMAVVTGTVNYAANQGVLSAGWVSMSSQVTLFYSMIFFSMGVSLLASTVWRVEHRGSSWNAMRATPHSPAAVVLAKTLIILVPTAAMQAALVAMTWVAGMALGLGPILPASLPVSATLAMLAAMPLVALQSLLSMLMRSFAAPVALCFGGCVAGFGMLAAGSPLVYAIPQGLVSRCLSLGSSALSDAGSLSGSDVAPVLVAAGLLGGLAWGLLAAVAHRTGGAR